MSSKWFETIKSYFVVILVVLLSAVFVLQFGGDQAQGCSQGGAKTAISVDGTRITETEYRAMRGFVSSLTRGQLSEQQIANGVVERVLLAREARKLGFDYGDQDVQNWLAENQTLLISPGVNAPQAEFMFRDDGNLQIEFDVAAQVNGEDDIYSAAKAKRFIQNNVQLSMHAYGEWQAEELLARRMRQVLAGTVTVAPSEVWAEYKTENDTATIEFAKFNASFFSSGVDFSPTAIRKWAEKNQDKIDETYNKSKSRFVGRPKEVRARHILVKLEGTDDEKEAARARAEVILRKAKGGADFIELAREESADDKTRPRGGDLGYRNEMQPPFQEQLFDLEPGIAEEIIETDEGLHIVQVLDIREGDISEEDAKEEIAEQLYMIGKSREVAKAEAFSVNERIRNGENFAQVMKEVATKYGFDPETEAADNAPVIAMRPAVRRGDMPVDGDSSAKVTSFAIENEAGTTSSKPLEVGNDYVVVRVLERTKAKKEEMTEEEKNEIRNRLLRQRKLERLRLAVSELREDAQKAGRITFDPRIVANDES